MALHRAPRYDLIGHVPKRRAGGLPLKHRVLAAAMKPAAAFDEVNNNPITRRALARKTGAQVAGAAAHVGGLMLLGKAATGHDAFKVSKSKVPGRIVRLAPRAGDDLSQRLRVNYSQWRSKVWYEGREAAKNEGRLRKITARGGPKGRHEEIRQDSILRNNPKRIAAAQETKRYADAQVQGIMNMNRRRPDRHLP